MEPLRLVGLLAEPNRRKIVAALLLGATNNEAICLATGLSTREVVDSLATNTGAAAAQ